MKSLETLLKIAQRKLDELGADAGRMQQHIDGLAIELAAMKAREDQEVRNASSDIQFASMLPAYRLRMKWRQDQMRVKIAESETTLGLVREKLAEAYQEKSKFEQLIEQARIRAAMERAAAEQKTLDEVAINRVGREEVA